MFSNVSLDCDVFFSLAGLVFPPPRQRLAGYHHLLQHQHWLGGGHADPHRHVHGRGRALLHRSVKGEPGSCAFSMKPLNVRLLTEACVSPEEPTCGGGVTASSNVHLRSPVDRGRCHMSHGDLFHHWFCSAGNLAAGNYRCASRDSFCSGLYYN